MTLPASDLERRAIQWLAFVLVVATGLVAWPTLPWLLLALWTANLARPVHARITRLTGGRARIAAAVTVIALTMLVVPIVLVLASLASDAFDLVRRLMSSARAQEILRRLVSSDDPQQPPTSDLVGLVMSQGGRAWSIAQQVAGTAARAVIGIVILISGTYALLVDGDSWYAWVERHMPISPLALRRLVRAFTETGRGLLFRSVGAALVQALVATVIYVALGVSQALVLGVLTLFVAFIPAIGTALVWLPVAAGLAVTDRPAAAAVLVILGLAVISTVDNLVRPYLARRGSLQLPTYMVLVAMFGGLALIGPWGVVVGPLTVRLAKEALSIVHDPRSPAGGDGTAESG